MKIKSLEGKILDVDLSEVYIKPFYRGKNIESYAICSNESNVEVVLGTYTSKVIAKHMVHLLEVSSRLEGFALQMLPEVNLAEDLWVTASYRLTKAREEAKKNEKLHRN